MKPFILTVNYSQTMDFCPQTHLDTVALTFPGPVLRHSNRTPLRNSELVNTEKLILDKTSIHS